MDAARDVVIDFLVLEIPFQGKEALAGTASVIVEVGSLFVGKEEKDALERVVWAPLVPVTPSAEEES